MTANAFDTLKAAKSLKAAGFDEAQAEAVVTTVGDAVRGHTAPLASSTATIANTMATKDDVLRVEGNLETVEDNLETVKDNLETVKSDLETVKSDLETVKDKVEMISETMATREYVKAAIAVEMKALYRHLWVMGTSAVGVTVALTKLLP